MSCYILMLKDLSKFVSFDTRAFVPVSLSYVMTLSRTARKANCHDTLQEAEDDYYARYNAVLHNIDSFIADRRKLLNTSLANCDKYWIEAHNNSIKLAEITRNELIKACDKKLVIAKQETTIEKYV